MKTAFETLAADAPQSERPKVVRRPQNLIRDRFTISEFFNASGTKAYRVSGLKRDGSRVRANFKNVLAAEAKKTELQNEYLARETQSTIRATHLTETQLRIAERAFDIVDCDDDVLLAVKRWREIGKLEAHKADSPRLHDALDSFEEWLDLTRDLRERTKRLLKSQLKQFGMRTPNIHVDQVAPVTVYGFLDKLENASPQTKLNYKLAISRFFSWCIEHPRQWASVNPCSAVKVKVPHKDSEPAILTVKECEALMRSAEKYRKGITVPYFAAALFGAMRPAEVERLTADNVNLADREIRIMAQASKVKRPRVVKMNDTLTAWLAAYHKKGFRPGRRAIDAVKTAIGYAGRVTEHTAELKQWPQDVLRHTGISHYFRNCGSYGNTAEFAGNSEAVIKKHYQGRVSTEDTKKFCAIMPSKNGGRK